VNNRRTPADQISDPSFGSADYFYDNTSYMRLDALKNAAWSTVRSTIENGSPLALVSAWSDDTTLPAICPVVLNFKYKLIDCNRKRSLDLLKELCTAGYPGIKIKGSYLSETSADCAIRHEIAYFIPLPEHNFEDVKEFVQNSCRLFEQSGAIYSDGNRAGLILASGDFRVTKEAGAISQENLLALWSAARGHNFTEMRSGIANGGGWFNYFYDKSGLISDLQGITRRELSMRHPRRYILCEKDKNWDLLRDGVRTS